MRDDVVTTSNGLDWDKVLSRNPCALAGATISSPCARFAISLTEKWEKDFNKANCSLLLNLHSANYFLLVNEKPKGPTSVKDGGLGLTR